MGNNIPAWAIAEHREDILKRKADELEDEIFELFAEAAATAFDLGLAGVQTDCLAGVDEWIRYPGWRGWLGAQLEVQSFLEAWNLDGCPALGIESMVLTTNGLLYFNRARKMAGGDEQIPVMEPAFLLRESDMAGGKAHVVEIRSRLMALRAKHPA